MVRCLFRGMTVMLCIAFAGSALAAPALDSADAKERQAAAKAAAAAPKAAERAAYTKLATTDAEPATRAYAVQALGKLKLSATQAVLEQVANTDKDPLVVKAATDALADLPASAGFSFLEYATMPQRPKILRIAALTTLVERLGSNVKYLMNLRLADGDTDVALAVAKLLKGIITKENLVTCLTQLGNAKNAAIKTQIALALAKLKDPSALWYAVQGLGRETDAALLEALVDLVGALSKDEFRKQVEAGIKDDGKPAAYRIACYQRLKAAMDKKTANGILKAAMQASKDKAFKKAADDIL